MCTFGVLGLSCESPAALGASWAPWKRGKPSATTSKRRSSNWPPGKRSRSWTLMLVDTLAPASLQMRAAQLSNGNPRRPSTPDVAHAARWWPRESSGWPHRQTAGTRGGSGGGGCENAAGPNVALSTLGNSGTVSQPWALVVNVQALVQWVPTFFHRSRSDGLPPDG